MRVYPERPSLESVQYKEVAERFEQPPKYEWSEDERGSVLAFERSLLDAKVPDGFVMPQDFVEPSKTVLNLNKAAVGEGKMWLGYFESPAGASVLEALREQAGLSETASTAQILATAATKVDIKTRRSLIKLSRDYAEKELKSGLEDWYEEGSRPEVHLDVISTISRPEALLAKAKGLSELRSYYRNISLALDNSADAGQDGKQIEMMKLVLQMQRERLNAIGTEIYTWAMLYEEQVAVSGEGREILIQIAEYLPGLHVRVSDGPIEMARIERFRSRLVGRLDRFINGANSSGHGPISDDLEQKYVGYTPPGQADNTDFIMSDVSPEILADTVASPEQMKEMAEMVLASWGLLSQDREYDPGKPTEASDGKWRVVVMDTATSFAVDGSKKIVKVPVKDMPLARISPAGALTVLDHELTHVLQHENSKLAGLAFIDNGRAARSSLWFEAGAVMEEYKSRERLFGVQTVSPSLNYLAAIEMQVAGGDMLDCAKAFADQELRTNPVADRATVLAAAANRVPRLFKRAGEFVDGTGEVSNSAVLAYSEQVILGEILPDDKKDWLLVGRLNPDMLSRLYELGWLDETKIKKLELRPSEVVMPYVRERLFLPQEGIVK